MYVFSHNAMQFLYKKNGELYTRNFQFKEDSVNNLVVFQNMEICVGGGTRMHFWGGWILCNNNA